MFSKPVVTRDRKVGKWEMVRGIKLQSERMNKPKDLVYRTRTIVNSTVLNTGNLLEDLIWGGFITPKWKLCEEMVC